MANRSRTTTTKAKTASSRPQSHHNLPKGLQYGEVVEVFEFETKKGKDMEMYTLALDGKRDPYSLFRLFEREGFKLELGDILVPVIRVAASAYLDSRGQAKPQNITVVEWVLSDGEVKDEDSDIPNGNSNDIPNGDGAEEQL